MAHKRSASKAHHRHDSTAYERPMSMAAAADGLGELIGKGLGFIAQGLLTSFGGAAVNIGVGVLLSFIKGEDPLEKEQVDQLKQVNQTLIGVRQDLGLLDSDLKGIEETLEQILGQAKLSTWLMKQDTIAEAVAHIETDFQNYIAYSTPAADGQLQKIAPALLQDLSNRAYKAQGLNDEEAVTLIQEAVLGSGAGDGLLDLYTNLLIDRMSKFAPADLSSNDLDYLANALVSYFARLLAFQVNGIAVVLDAKHMDGVDAAIRKADWQSFQDSVKEQGKVLFDALWNLIVAWRQGVQANQTGASGGNFGLITWLFDHAPADLYSNNDLLPFVPGGPVYSSKSETAWLTNTYNSVVASPEQPYLANAESLIAALTAKDDKSRRVIIHVLFYIGTNVTLNDTFAKPIPLAPAIAPETVEVRSSVSKQAGGVTFFWVRHVFDLESDGTYTMADVRSQFPTWPGYAPGSESSKYTFQSDADLKLAVTVNPKTPVGIIRFAPYVQHN